jgi:hypothetical protein
MRPTWPQPDKAQRRTGRLPKAPDLFDLEEP